PVNWTPTSFSLPDSDSQTWTTRPWVEKSESELRERAELPARREPYCDKGMRISRSEPMATSKRVTKAAPLRQRFSLEVSSSKAKPRESRPLTFSGNRTAILRSERCLETVVLASGTMGWVLLYFCSDAALVSGDRRAVIFFGGRKRANEKAFHTFEDFTGRSRQ